MGSHELGKPLPPIACHYCGRKLEQVVSDQGDIRIYLPLYETCNCPAAAEAAAAAKLEEEHRAALAEDRRHKARVRALLKKSGIWALYREKSFDGYRVTPENRRACAAVRAYVRKFDELRQNGKGLYLAGSCGVGKTHLAAAAALELIGREHSVICMVGIDLLARIKQAYDDQSNLSEYDTLKDYLDVGLLIIDDLGKEHVTSWSLSMLYTIINMRAGNLLPMFITTNYTDEQLTARLGRSGDMATARAIVSRLHEVCYGLEIGGPDYRSVPLP